MSQKHKPTKSPELTKPWKIRPMKITNHTDTQGCAQVGMSGGYIKPQDF